MVAPQEMEFTIVYDTLVRAGIECTSAFVPSASEFGLSRAGGWGVGDVLVTCSRGGNHGPTILCLQTNNDVALFPIGVKITADTTLNGLQAQVTFVPLAVYSAKF
jgi:hypothetical protein